MTTRLIVGIAMGIGIGALMGYFGKCASGTCPLTANPYRGAIYGGLLGFLFALSAPGTTRAPTPPRDAQSTNASTAPYEIESDKQETVQAALPIRITTAKEFRHHVANAKIPCIVDFYSDHCGPCKMLAPTIKELAATYAGQAIVCKVSLDAAPELAQPYQITGIPAVLFFAGGHETQRLVGLQPLSAYKQVIDSMLAKSKSSPEEVSHADF